MTARVENLAASIDFQDGAVVSRTVVKKPAGTVTLFAFDKGEGLSEHTTPHDALVQVLEGTAEITVGGEASTVRSGESILMPADVPHALRAVDRFKMLLTMIKS
jgi:quercetin dioxygenase-like cupin family protein